MSIFQEGSKYIDRVYNESFAFSLLIEHEHTTTIGEKTFSYEMLSIIGR